MLERNLGLLDPNDDYWVTQRVSRGGPDGPTVIVECAPLPLAARAHLYRDGIRVVVPSLRRVPPESLSPRAKTHNYLNLIAADLAGCGESDWVGRDASDGRRAEQGEGSPFPVRTGSVSHG